jgi:hypothetical protein|tara:strand:- start:49 stop:243 length:195 start_codon:yes stop_codon:yes gene_type:complete
MRFEGTLQTEQNMIDNSRSEKELRVIVQGLASQTIKNMLKQREGTVSTLTKVLKEEHLKRLSIN